VATNLDALADGATYLRLAGVNASHLATASSYAADSVGAAALAHGINASEIGFNAAQLGGYGAASFPRKAENATIAGFWTMQADATNAQTIGDLVVYDRTWKPSVYTSRTMAVPTSGTPDWNEFPAWHLDISNLTGGSTGGQGSFGLWINESNINAQYGSHVGIEIDQILNAYSGSPYAETGLICGAATCLRTGSLAQGAELWAKDSSGGGTAYAIIMGGIQAVVFKRAASNAYHSTGFLATAYPGDAGQGYAQTGDYAPDAAYHCWGTWKYGLNLGESLSGGGGGQGVFTLAEIRMRAGYDHRIEFDTANDVILWDSDGGGGSGCWDFVIGGTPKIRVQDYLQLLGTSRLIEFDSNDYISLSGSAVWDFKIAGATAVLIASNYLQVPTAASDPSGAAGRIYYNTTSNVLKAYDAGTSTWKTITWS